MKKNVFYYLFAVLFSVALFPSCGDDDLDDGGSDDDSVVDEDDDAATDSLDIADNFVGEYKGTLDVSVGGALMPSSNQNIVIEKSGSDSIDLTISNFTFMGTIEVGDVNLDYCVLETEDDVTYTCHREDTITFANTLIGTCPVESGITLWGDSVTVELDITWNGVDVNVVYNGKKLTGTESTEAYILAFSFDSSLLEANARVVSSRVNDDYTISVVVDSTADVTGLVPTITVSDGATVSPESGVAQDFSSPVTYTVLSESGTVTNEYTVSITGYQTSFYGFEDWTEDTSTTNYSFPVADGWASCNQAVMLIKMMGEAVTPAINYTGDYPVNPTDDSYSGTYAAKLEAVDTQGGYLSFFNQTIPKVTPATLFLGTFNAYAAMSDAMATTSFGTIYSKKPLSVSGYYKYTPGDVLYDVDGNVLDGQDACSMAAVLYEVDSESETLDGSNIYTSDKIVAMGMFTSSETVSEYTEFNIELDYDDYRDYDSSKLHKFAIIFSTSVDGANYNAAVGSTLYIDDVSVLTE